MQRQLNLRQIEGFKAMIECGTVSAAAAMLNISQPAMSKLIAHLEGDTGLKLFDRQKKRLTPTPRAMRLYDEVERIFAGVRQVDNAVEAIRREEEGRLTIGVMPALSGTFIQRTTMDFLKDWPKVFCSIQSHNSERITEWLVSEKLDIGLVNGRIQSRYILSEPLVERSLVCIMPPGHPLARRKRVRPRDLDGLDFVSTNFDNFGGQRVASMLDAHSVKTKTVLVANMASTMCEFVAGGMGVSLVHPLFAAGFEGRLAIRRFEPAIPYHFQICRSLGTKNAELIHAFFHELRAKANEFCSAVLRDAVL